MNQSQRKRARFGLPHRALALGALMAPLLACDEPAGVSERRIPKGVESPPSEWIGSPAIDTRTPDASNWPIPDTWRLRNDTRPMRLATFEAPATDGWVEVAITRFPGRVGGELANVNRWREQIGLGPISEAELLGAIERFTCEAGPGYLARLSNEHAQTLAIAVYESAADRTWFVRANDTPTNIESIEAAARRLACALPASAK